ncbi:post-GPI attachment to proteins factor 3 isoform X2 [Wyeomyia smithii]|uniref:post-GPI attachment to proteins factor 3 isoform X2 n=1 Tax=Wyeomyia smithii TaxID=174621 RepID=UPI002467FAC9|nr:post-GPI attachment to proteins factor 3 isoform X2 [Wyeomyia smithii]
MDLLRRVRLRLHVANDEWFFKAELDGSAVLRVGRFDYAYNMKANIVTGMTGAAGWISWCFFQRRKRRYVWKCFIFIVLATSSLLLEINDFPPILWTFDAHSIWHLITAPLTVLFYSFIIDDCKSLRQELYGSEQGDTRKLL